VERYNVDDVCKLFQIAESTLRKYALLLEENGYSFEKNNNGRRIYYQKDLDIIKRFLNLKCSNKKVKNEVIIANILDDRYQFKKIEANNEIFDTTQAEHYKQIEESLQSILQQQNIVLQNLQKGLDVLDKKIEKIQMEQDEQTKFLVKILSIREKGIIEKLIGK